MYLRHFAMSETKRKRIKLNHDALSKKTKIKGESLEINATLPKVHKKHKLQDIDIEGLSKPEITDAITSAVEYYMIKGHKSTPRLAMLLGVSNATVEACKKKVIQRWSIVTPAQKEQQKGRLTATYDMLLDKSIGMMESDPDPKNKLSAMRLAKDIVKDIAELTGVKEVENTVTNNVFIMEGDRKRDNIKMMAQQFNEILQSAPVATVPKLESKNVVMEIDAPVTKRKRPSKNS